MTDLKELTDDRLVKLYANGNNEAFDMLLVRYQSKLYSYIFFTVKNEALAEDLFQETFMKAIMRIQQGKYVETGKFSAWITRIAHNLIIDRFRQDNNENTVSNNDATGDIFNNLNLAEESIESQWAKEQKLKDVESLMNKLPDNQREVVYMRYYQDLSFKEIANITGVSINTALGRMRYALLNMRRMAESYQLF